MKVYQQQESEEQLKSLSLETWKAEPGFIGKEFRFRDFKEAIQFMVKVGEIAEELNHHPNWSNVYNKVHIQLSTHDAGGVTDKDFELAQMIEGL